MINTNYNLSPLAACVTMTSPQQCVKKAERVKLRCASKNEPQVEPTPDTDLSNEVSSSSQSLINHLISISSLISLQDINLVEHLVCTPNPLIDNLLAPLQLELERLKMRNTLLALTLDESKEHTEHLYLLCGKYESNAVALQLALNCSDRAIEAYDVMLALLESRWVQLESSLNDC